MKLLNIEPFVDSGWTLKFLWSIFWGDNLELLLSSDSSVTGFNSGIDIFFWLCDPVEETDFRAIGVL